MGLHLYGKGLEVPRGDWQAIVVLGAGLDRHGEATPSLRHRVERGVELWREGVAPLVIFSGGNTTGRSEAEAAAEVAEGLGLPREVMRLEERSTSTRENAAFTAAAYPLRRVVIVSNAYHLFRARRVFAHFFDEVAAAPARTELSAGIRGSLREVLALGWYAVHGWL